MDFLFLIIISPVPLLFYLPPLFLRQKKALLIYTLLAVPIAAGAAYIFGQNLQDLNLILLVYVFFIFVVATIWGAIVKLTVMHYQSLTELTIDKRIIIYAAGFTVLVFLIIPIVFIGL